MRRRNRANRQPTDAERIQKIMGDVSDALARHDAARLRLAVLNMRIAVDRRARGLAEGARLSEQRLNRRKADREQRDLIERLSRSLAALSLQLHRKIARESGVPI